MNAKILCPIAARPWRILQIASCLVLGTFPLQGQGVKIRWPATPESNITGYVLYLGPNAGALAALVSVGNVTNYTLTNLTVGQNYFAGVTAVNDFGLESPLAVTASSFRFNSQPTLSGPATVTIAQSSAAPIAGLSVSDVDAITNLTLSLSATRGTLSVVTSIAGGITAAQVSGNGSGSVAITASLAAINATLRSNGVVYMPRLNLVGADTLMMSVSDNDNVAFGGPASNLRTVSLNVLGSLLEVWRNQYFPASDLTDASKEAAVWGDLADPDQDGRQNLMEFALRLNPLNREASSAGIASDLVEINGKKYLTITFRQLKNAAFLQYLPQVSGDKQDWWGGSGAVQLLSATDLDAQTQLVTYQDLTPVDPQTPRFMRLKVIRN